MGRIVSNFFISLDGVVEAPDQWHFPYFDDAMGAVVGEGLATTRGMLLGRRLYDEWSEYWPDKDGDGEFGSLINALPKHVLTHRPLGDAPWRNSTAITEDHATAVRALRESTDGDLTLSGCATTVRWLIAEGLLDELALLVHPIAVARGQRLFEDTGTVPLRLVHEEALPSGVLHLRYAPA